MAGIYVSGGTFSGSGDLTIDYIQVSSDASVEGGTFYAPDGTLKLVDTGCPENTTYQLRYCNGSVIYNQSGTTLFAGAPAATTYLYNHSYAYEPQYPYYNVILDDSSNSGILLIVSSIWVENDVTVKANRTLETATNDYIKALGNVNITGTNSKIDTNHNSMIDQYFGSLEVDNN